MRQLRIFQIFWACVPEIGVLRKMQKKTCDAYRGILEEDQQTMRLNPLDEAQMDTIFYQRNGEIGSTDTELNKELSDKLNLNSEAAYLPQNRETAYSQLVRFLKAKSP